MASIVNGLFAGRSGIQSHGSAIGVLADNIANSNTVGFKSSRPEFVDLLAGNLGTGTSGLAVGSGSSLSGITQIFSQGTFEFTGRGLDLGIDGGGFFIVQDSSNTRFYSRAGNFKVDADGNLLNQNGLQVLGFPQNGAGGLEALNVNTVSQQSSPTTQVDIAGNLDASAPVATPPGGAPTFAQLQAAASFTTFVDVFDSLGAKHAVTVYFYNLGSGDWQVDAYVDGSEVTGGTPGLPELIGSTTGAGFTDIEFGSDGTRTTIPTSTAPDFTAVADWANGATDGDIDFLFNPFTQFASPSNISSISQNGSGTGSVVSFSVESNGTLFALLDNGQTSSIGTIALANFSNPEGLQRRGDSLFANTSASGEPVVGIPGSGQFGAIQSGAIELSTADVAADFIKLISLQRGFQSSARIINNIDDLLNEIVNLA